jgi:NADH-quinone oxidoreductase subunit L
MTFDLRLIPLLPFLGAVVLMLFGRKMARDTVFVIATLAIGAACMVSIDAFFTRLPDAGPGGLSDVVTTWIATGDLHIDLAFRMDALSGVMCLVITFVGFLIHVFAAGYMADDPDYARFFAYLNLFCGAMLVLVLGDNLPVMFIGWEGVGLCSYLLIGFWYSSTANASAGKKAFITNRIGDLGFLIGMFLLFQYAGTLSIPEISGAATDHGPLMATWLGQPVAFWAALFLFVGATGKSAQIPLYVWLPDAMAGPTPVSALIHAATMVTAGVYMIARMHAVFMLAPVVMAIVAVVGAATAMFAAIIGFAQNDFKKVLAYSTVSQLGFMFASVGTTNFEAGIFHLVTHAFFKAGLFLCAGSVMHAMSGSGDITIMGGLRKKLPWTHAVFAACWLAICGIVPFSGFFSKDAIIAGAFNNAYFNKHGLGMVGNVVCVMLLLAALGTAFYMSRLYFLVFSGDETRADDKIKHHIHESPAIMVVPLVVLAIGATVIGFIGLPAGLWSHPEQNLLAETLKPVVGAELEVSHGTEIGFMIGSLLLAGLGIVLAIVFYRGGYKQPARAFGAKFPGFLRLVQDKFRIDEIYDKVIIRPIRAFARGLFVFVDRILVDKVLVEGLGFVVDLFSRIARAVQGGDGQRYMAVFAVGVAVLVHFATQPTLPFTKMKVTQAGRAVDVDARRSKQQTHPLDYAFDFGDGRPVVKGTGAEQHHDYDRAGRYTIRVTVTDPRWGTEDDFNEKVEVP